MMKKKTKVMIVAPYFLTGMGGLQNYAYQISKGLVKNYNFDVFVVTSNHQQRKYSEEIAFGIKIYRLPIWFKVSNTPINPFWYFKIRQIIKKEKPDLINAHAPVPFIADVSALASGNLLFLLTYHAGLTIFKRGLFLDFLTKLYEHVLVHYLLGRADTIISISDFVKSTFLKNYAAKTVVIPPGVDTDCFKPKKTKPGNQVLFVGSLKKAERYKGLKVLINAIGIAVKKVKNIKVVVVGDGGLVDKYKKMCRYLGIEKQIKFRGRLNAQKLAKEYQKAAVFVHPSLFDNCPLVLLEAMACKKPAIGSNIGGIPYVIDDGKTGLLVPPRDPEALAKAIIKILKNPKIAQKMGENGYRKVKENFTWERQVEKTERVMRDLGI